MSGRYKGSGVGRGNGVGSKRTQFKDGAPSPNPTGRPRKRKLATLDIDLLGAVRRALCEPVEVHENGVKRRMSQVDAMAKMLIASFPKAPARDKIALFKLFTTGEAPISEMQSHNPSAQAIADFVDGLAEQAEEAKRSRED